MSKSITNDGGTHSNTIECLNISEKKVGLFVTCLVNTMRPSIGFASITLLEQAGCTVEVPDLQSCCGQPAFNSGDAIVHYPLQQYPHYLNWRE